MRKIFFKFPHIIAKLDNYKNSRIQKAHGDHLFLLTVFLFVEVFRFLADEPEAGFLVVDFRFRRGVAAAPRGAREVVGRLRAPTSAET